MFLDIFDLFLLVLKYSWVFLTDFLDGLLARKMGMVTQAGMIFDPVADKLVVLAMFGYLFAVKRVPSWYVGLVFVRDLAQLASIPILLWWKKCSQVSVNSRWLDLLARWTCCWGSMWPAFTLQ